MKDGSVFVVLGVVGEDDLGRERRVWARRISDLCEIGVSKLVGREASAAEEGEKLRRGESWGRNEIAERISGVVVRRTIVRNGFLSLTHVLHVDAIKSLVWWLQTRCPCSIVLALQ